MAHPANPLSPPFVIVSLPPVVPPLQIHNHNLNTILSRARNLLPPAVAIRPKLSSFAMVGKRALPAAEPNEHQHWSDPVLCEETRARLEYFRSLG